MLLLLELNEVNFEYVQHYVDLDLLPNFKTLFDRHGYSETISEVDYENLEPWIQWVTAHTGLTFEEHGVHRLGDIVHHDFDQIWETLARRGLRVGAISPMNAKCRSKDLAFFVPDPWTRTDVIAQPVVKRLYSAISQAVGDNAQARITPSSLINLAVGMALTVPAAKYPRYLGLIANASRKPWLKSIVLDQLLSDLFIKLVRKNRTQFASLFLNAGAHIQHHYMFSSAAYGGEMRNPVDYIGAQFDPLLDVYRTYDRIIGDIMRSLPNARVMLATGLHQDPHPSVTYYWRLRDHAAYLTKLGIEFASVDPRMSRDFFVTFNDRASADRAKAVLESAKTEDGESLFEVDHRGTSLFVMLTYPNQIAEGLRYSVGTRSFDDLHTDVVFVALKNGQHNGIGYFLDTQAPKPQAATRFPLKDLPQKILTATTAD